MNNIIKEYLDRVSAGMTCPKRTKKYFLQELGALTESYIAEHPDATGQDLENEFGKPEDYKTNLADKETYREMLKRAEKKARLFLILCAILGVVAVLAICFIIYLIDRYGGTVVYSNIEEVK